jgi:hypothetical protein
LTRKVVAGELDTDDAGIAWNQIAAMPIALHDLDDGPRAIEIALELRRESAYMTPPTLHWPKSLTRSY